MDVANLIAARIRTAGDFQRSCFPVAQARARQHFLCLRPLPHGHGSFLPTLASGRDDNMGAVRPGAPDDQSGSGLACVADALRSALVVDNKDGDAGLGCVRLSSSRSSVRPAPSCS